MGAAGNCWLFISINLEVIQGIAISPTAAATSRVERPSPFQRTANPKESSGTSPMMVAIPKDKMRPEERKAYLGELHLWYESGNCGWQWLPKGHPSLRPYRRLERGHRSSL